MSKTLAGWVLVRVPFLACRQLPLTAGLPWCVCRAVQGSGDRRGISPGASSNKDSVLSGLDPTFMVSFNCLVRVLSPSIVRTEG